MYPLAYLKNYMFKLYPIFLACRHWLLFGSSLTTDDHAVSGVLPVLLMTSCVDKMARHCRRREVSESSLSEQGAAAGAKSKSGV